MYAARNEYAMECLTWIVSPVKLTAMEGWEKKIENVPKAGKAL